MKRAIIITLCCLLSLTFTDALAQQKKVIDQTVYPIWKTIKNTTISNDGNWVSYEINPLKGDGYLYIVNPAKNSKDSIAR